MNVAFAVDGVSVELPGGALTFRGLRIDAATRLVLIRGRSGVGKTLLLSLLADFVRCSPRPDPGVGEGRRVYCAQVNGGLQGYTGAGNVLLGGAQADLSALFTAHELREGLAGQLAERLSCGQVARLALLRSTAAARAAGGSSLLLLDEPTANLDAESASRVALHIASLPEHVRVVCASHDRRSDGGGFWGELTAAVRDRAWKVQEFHLRREHDVVHCEDVTGVAEEVPASPADQRIPALRSGSPWFELLLGRLWRWVGPWLLAATVVFFVSLAAILAIDAAVWRGHLDDSNAAWTAHRAEIEQRLAKDVRARSIRVELLGSGDGYAAAEAALAKALAGVREGKLQRINSTRLLDALERGPRSMRRNGLVTPELPIEHEAYVDGAGPPAPLGTGSIVLAEWAHKELGQGERLDRIRAVLPKGTRLRRPTTIDLDVVGTLRDSYLDEGVAYVIAPELDALLQSAIDGDPESGGAPLQTLAPRLRMAFGSSLLPVTAERLATHATVEEMQLFHRQSGSQLFAGPDEAATEALSADLGRRGYRIGYWTPSEGRVWKRIDWVGPPDLGRPLFAADAAVVARLVEAAGGVQRFEEPLAEVAPAVPYEFHRVELHLPHVRHVEAVCEALRQHPTLLRIRSASGLLLGSTWSRTEAAIDASAREATKRAAEARDASQAVIVVASCLMLVCLAGLVLLLHQGNDVVLLACGRSRWALAAGHATFFAASVGLGVALATLVVAAVDGAALDRLARWLAAKWVQVSGGGFALGAVAAFSFVTALLAVAYQLRGRLRRQALWSFVNRRN